MAPTLKAVKSERPDTPTSVGSLNQQTNPVTQLFESPETWHPRGSPKSTPKAALSPMSDLRGCPPPPPPLDEAPQSASAQVALPKTSHLFGELKSLSHSATGGVLGLPPRTSTGLLSTPKASNAGLETLTPKVMRSVSSPSMLSFGSRLSTTGRLLREYGLKQHGRAKGEWLLQEGAPFEEVVNFFRRETVGMNRLVDGPFGTRLLLYLDYTASGRSLHFVNEYLMWVRQMFANTHTEDSATGLFMTEAFQAALDAISRCLHVEDGEFLPICVGTGCTGALQKLQQILGIYVPPASWVQMAVALRSSAPYSSVPAWMAAREEVKFRLREAHRLPLVFVSGYEHHSNEISWREGLCDCVRVPLTTDFRFDIDALKRLATESSARHRPVIGSFSACSNVTGMVTDVQAVSEALKEKCPHALIFFDFAASAPHVDIDLRRNWCDGVVFSPHKFLGGDGSCGILMLRKDLYKKDLPPSMAGGGTVDWVLPEAHRFSEDIIARENAGTPGSLQVLQAALALEVKAAVGPTNIITREHALLTDFMNFLRTELSHSVTVLGNQDPELRVAIVSFNFVDPPLHPTFVARILSDLFGVQTRAGCSCAGPHGADLLGFEDTRATREIVFQLTPDVAKKDIVGDAPSLKAVKPGWCRLNLPWTMVDYELDYLKGVFRFVHTYGKRFLSLYELDVVSGAWSFKDRPSHERQDEGANFGLSAACGRSDLGKLLDGGEGGAVDEDTRRIVFEAHLKSAEVRASTLSDPVCREIKCVITPKQDFYLVASSNVMNLDQLALRHGLMDNIDLYKILPSKEGVQKEVFMAMWRPKFGFFLCDMDHVENEIAARARAAFWAALLGIAIYFAAVGEDQAFMILVSLLCFDSAAASVFGLTPFSPLGVLSTVVTVFGSRSPPRWGPARFRRFAWFLDFLLMAGCLCAEVFVDDEALRDRIIIDCTLVCAGLAQIEAALDFSVGGWSFAQLRKCCMCRQRRPSKGRSISDWAIL